MTLAISGTTGITLAGQFDSASTFGWRNRIINGGMVIDQRNAGAAVTTSASYVTDRFTQAFANASCSFQQVSDAPSGFINSLKLTVTAGSAPSAGTNNVIIQKIEGLNVFDFSFGSASAANVTLSFWVKGSVTGTYAVSLTNSAFSRSYVATYTINAANTWEQKTVTIAGDTTGTWLTTNGVGLTVLWDFGSGTSLNTTAGAWQAGNFYRTSACTTIAATTNATLQITGVQLEKGSTATSFDFRSYGTELALCQRYALLSTANVTVGTGVLRTGGTAAYVFVPIPVSFRATPTSSLAAASFSIYSGDTTTALSTVSVAAVTSNGLQLNTTQTTVGANGAGVILVPGATLIWSAEL